jgi:hypothetical protein
MLARYRSLAVPLAVVAAAVLFYMVKPVGLPGGRLDRAWRGQEAEADGDVPERSEEAEHGLPFRVMR